MSFTTKYPKSSSTIGTKKNLKVKLLLFTKHCLVQKNIVRMHVTEHSPRTL